MHIFMEGKMARFHLKPFEVSFPRTLSKFSKVFLIIKVRHRDIQPPNKRFLFSDLGYHTQMDHTSLILNR